MEKKEDPSQIISSNFFFNEIMKGYSIALMKKLLK